MFVISLVLYKDIFSFGPPFSYMCGAARMTIVNPARFYTRSAAAGIGVECCKGDDRYFYTTIVVYRKTYVLPVCITGE